LKVKFGTFCLLITSYLGQREFSLAKNNWVFSGRDKKAWNKDCEEAHFFFAVAGKTDNVASILFWFLSFFLLCLGKEEIIFWSK
jgi:hypothetical protein